MSQEAVTDHRNSRIDMGTFAMGTPGNKFDRGITPEERRLIMRAAHLERAQAIRRTLWALLSWQRTSDHHAAAKTAPSVAQEHFLPPL